MKEVLKQYSEAHYQKKFRSYFLFSRDENSVLIKIPHREIF